MERLMWHLSTAASPTDAQLFAPAHLAAVMLSEVAQSREVAAEKGEADSGRSCRKAARGWPHESWPLAAPCFHGPAS